MTVLPAARTVLKEQHVCAPMLDGTPRVINKLCNASLLIGNSSNLNVISTDAVMQAINDRGLG